MKRKSILKFIFLMSLFFVSNTVWSQGTLLGIHGTTAEYDGELGDSYYYRFKNVEPGGAISIQQYLNTSFNLMGKASYTQVKHSDKIGNAFNAQFITLNAKLKYKFDNGYILKEEFPVAPFLMAGVGGSYITLENATMAGGGSYIIADKTKLKPNFAVGGGITFKFNDRVGLELANTLNLPMDDAWDGRKSGDYNDVYLVHSLGLVFNLSKAADSDGDGISDKRDSCPETPPGVAVDAKGCPVDLDKDGVPDYLDQCKDVAGKPELNGCPDRDGDGVPDKDDKCPDSKGLARFQGCPDTDGDGVEDAKDKCPNVKGLDIFQGCPDTDGDGVEDAKDKCPNTEKGIRVDVVGCPQDTDGDGVIDSKDKCPTTAGDPNNNGCPVVKEEVKKRLAFATRGINFETGKSTLKTTSYPMLDEIIAILNEYTDYNLRIGGHTDNVGKDDANMKLSQERVDAVKSYLVTKGNIPESRFEATGYGATRPIADNKTAAGRAQNRRVELELYLK